MPAVIVKSKRGWVVVSHRGKGGRVLGTHRTRKEALAQQRAVNRRLRKGKK